MTAVWEPAKPLSIRFASIVRLSWRRLASFLATFNGSIRDICSTQLQVPPPFNVFIRNIATQARPPSRPPLATLPNHALNRLIETLGTEGLILVERQSEFADHFFVEMIPE